MNYCGHAGSVFIRFVSTVRSRAKSRMFHKRSKQSRVIFSLYISIALLVTEVVASTILLVVWRQTQERGGNGWRYH